MKSLSSSVQQRGHWSSGFGFVRLLCPLRDPQAYYRQVATRRITSVGMIEKGLVIGTPSLAGSPDGRCILYAQVDLSSSDILLLRNVHLNRDRRYCEG
jgi:hypothetical protein